MPTLIGVVVGSVGSYTAAALMERNRWRRGRAERWDEKRFEIYTAYANTLKAQIRIAQRLGAARGFRTVLDPIDLDDGMRLLADAESKRSAEWESVLLIGDADTVKAARAWHESVWNYELYARGRQADSEEDWVHAESQMSQARDEFYACARRDLSIPCPTPPSGNWPRHWQDGASPH
ncbi:hypothetical protein J7E89_17965 [Streptomyces sp. ISL-100]|nr:hypothetical protein [Streptomyces sp. ISL-100]